MGNDDHFFSEERVVIHFSKLAQEAGCQICQTLRYHSQGLLFHLLLNSDTFVQKVKEVHPDFIFLDENEQSSSQIHQLRQEHSECAEIPIVIVSEFELSSKRKSELLNTDTFFWILSEQESSPEITIPLEGLLNSQRTQTFSFFRDRDFKQFVKGVKEYAIIMLDRNGSIQDWNEGAVQIFGYQQSEIIGNPFHILFAPEEVTNGRPMREMKKAALCEQAQDYNWLIRKNQSLFWAEGFLVPLKTQRGRVKGFVKIIQEKTYEKETQGELDQLHSKFKEKTSFLQYVMRVMRMIPAGIRIVEASSGKTLFLNSESSRLFGEKSSQILIHEIANIYPAQLLDGHVLSLEEYPIMRALMRGETVINQEIKVKNLRGEWISLAVYSAPIRSKNDQIVAAISIHFDITKQKEIEDKLTQALQLRDEFLSIATHELNTPLSSLLLNLQLLQRRITRRKDEGIPASDLLREVDSSVRQVQRLSKMLSDLLDLSRIRSNRFTLEIDAFNLCDVIRDVLSRVQRKAKASGVEIRVFYGVENLVGYWDRMKIEQVITNLLSNALKYGAGKPIDIELDKSNHEAIIRVRDYGIGISPSDQSRIFERYTRASDRAKSESLGLGLYIVHQIVKAHGGSISVASQKDQGSTFTVHLPLTRLKGGGGE